MKFYTQFERPEKVDVEKNSGELLVEKGGYIPMKRQIEQFMSSGERLASARKVMSLGYDFAPGENVDENYYDPTREPGFDLADASAIAKALQDKERSSIKPKSNASSEEAGSAASDEGSDASDIADVGKEV
ncbi:MAG: hypothetical protein QXG67_04170 [Candidatus Nitrosotenuis sp.]